MGQAVTFSAVRVAPPGSAGEPAFVMNDFVMAGGEPGGATYWGQMDVSVDGMALSGLAMSLQPGMTVTGKITFKATRLIPDRISRAVDALAVQTQAYSASRSGRRAQSRARRPVPHHRRDAGRYRLNGTCRCRRGSGPAQAGRCCRSWPGPGRSGLPIDIGPNDGSRTSS